MNKLFYLLILLSSFTFAQIKVVDPVKKETIGEIAPMGQLHIKVVKYPDTNEYTFIYSDAKFTKITDLKSFTFKDEDNAFENLYKMIIDGLAKPPKESIMLELPDSFIWLDYVKALGTSNVRIGHSVGKTDVIGYSVWLTKKKVDKLFGKSK